MSQFKIFAKLILVLVFAKLVKKIQVKCIYFIYNHNLKFNLKIYIIYKSTIINEKIKTKRKIEIIISKTI